MSVSGEYVHVNLFVTVGTKWSVTGFNEIECHRIIIVVYYETIKRELNKRLIYECRCDEKLKAKAERSTRLADTVSLEREYTKPQIRKEKNKNSSSCINQGHHKHQKEPTRTDAKKRTGSHSHSQTPGCGSPGFRREKETK